MMQFSLDGVEEALSSVASIAAALTPHNLRTDGLAALQPVVDDARTLAPVDRGRLRDSIEARPLEDGYVGVVIGDWKGHFFEFGTVHMRAHPILLPAFDANEKIVIEMFGGRVGARIEDAS